MARNYPKAARPYCAPPAGYAGKLYYRLQPNLTAMYPNWQKIDAVDRNRGAILDDVQNRNRRVLSSGLVVNETGNLLPEWQVPIKVAYSPEKQPYEFNGIMMTERVHDVVESVEPGRHIFVPHDYVAQDGKIARWYRRMFGETYLLATAPPALHPVLNQLETYWYNLGGIGFLHPDWARVTVPTDDGDFDHFGYLNENVVGGRHLFNLELLDNQMVLSAELFDLLRNLGDNVLDRRDYWIPIGSAPHDEPEGGYEMPKPPPAPKAEQPSSAGLLTSIGRFFKRP